MPKGPLGNRRLTTIGPFTYDEASPPEVPSGFEPPDDITNALGDFTWWTNFPREGDKGATILYDPEKDRVIIENRLSGPDGDIYTHDDMIVDLVEKSPIPRVPSLMLPAEGGVVTVGKIQDSSLEIPTAAGGAWVVTKRLEEDKDLIEEGERVKVNWFYKIVYAIRIISFPEDTLVTLRHKLGPRANTVFEAKRQFELGDAYKLLQFENQLPEIKV